MARRANGEGTIRQRRDRRREARLTIATVDGRQVRRSYFGRTRREVQDKLDAERQAVRQGFGASGNARETTGGYLTRWLEAAKPTMRPRTWEGYALIVRVHLAPAIGSIPLARLGAADVQRMVNDGLTRGRKPQTVRNAHAVLRRALNQAVRWGIVARNVATMVDLPRTVRFEAPVLTAEAARTVLAAVAGDRIGPVSWSRWRPACAMAKRSACDGRTWISRWASSRSGRRFSMPASGRYSQNLRRAGHGARSPCPTRR